MPTPTKPQAAQDARYMAQALALAALGRGRTAPNPMVGCVVVQNGRVVGTGWHRAAGEAHAEVLALAVAGRRARGATLYATREPFHHEGHTGPCTAALLAAGVRRVVVAADDPDVRVQGRGVRYLRRRGLQVDRGVLAGHALRLNAAYNHAKRTGRAYVVAKLAQSLDGCIATRDGASQWITGPQARRRGHELRARVDAIMVGRGTVLADDPRLTCRVAGGRDPARVVLASLGQLPRNAQVLQVAGGAKTYVVVGPHAAPAQLRALQRHGAEILQVALGPGGVDLRATLAALAQRGLHAVLAEGGPTLLGALFDAGLVQRLYAFVAPSLMGGGGKGSVAGRGAAQLEDMVRLTHLNVQAVGPDWLLRGNVAAPLGPSKSRGKQH